MADAESRSGVVPPDGDGGAASGNSRPTPPVGLVRGRLTSRLMDPATFRIGWVVAPAGSGKSRLLAHVADVYRGPVAWCGAPDPVPRSEASLVAWIWAGVRQLDDEPGEVPAVPETVAALIVTAGQARSPVLLVLDDVHLVEGSEAEAALWELIARLPPQWRLLMASRVSLGFDLSRMRVSGEVVDIGPDDLRFRTWEVEELFRDVYGEPLLPEDVAVLARRTSGWAAYLQLFFLATARKPQGERRSVLGSLQNRTRLVSEYLGRHALAGLDPELQEFLVRTSVLRRPTAALCDELLGRTAGSRDLLGELERRQLFTERIDDSAYRYHSVLLSYLDAKLVETIGLEAAKAEHHKAAELLEREGLTEEGLAAYARAEDWEGVGRLLGRAEAPADGLGDEWIDALPPSLLEGDPLLLLVVARRAVGRGSLTEALQALRRAEAVAASASVAEQCRQERERIRVWAETGPPARSDWIGLIRTATQHQPVQIQRQAQALGGVHGRFAEGVAAFVGGDCRKAQRLMRAITQHPDGSPALSAAAAVVGLGAVILSGRSPGREELERTREEVDASGVRWLERLAQAPFISPDGAGSGAVAEAAEDLIAACERQADRWGAAFIRLLAGVTVLRLGDRGAEEQLTLAGRSFAELGAGVLEATALAFAALAGVASGDTDRARSAAGQARTLAALHEVPGATGLSTLASGLLSGDPREQSRAREVLEPFGCWGWFERLCGLPDPEVADGPATDGGQERREAGDGPLSPGGAPEERAPGSGGTALRCLGGYSLVLDGGLVDETTAKPMERALLHILSMRANESVHREELIDALWPDAGTDAGLHRLQVAVSSLRRLLGPRANSVLVRTGDSYQLALPADADVDLIRLEQAFLRATRARSRDDVAAEEEALDDAARIYVGPLLQSDGPTDWVVERRAWLQRRFTDAMARLGSLKLQRDDPAGASVAARAGIAADRYRDDVWKILIEASERAGNYADAERARRSYEAVLNELGV